jgi:hypothetical protein
MVQAIMKLAPSLALILVTSVFGQSVPAQEAAPLPQVAERLTATFDPATPHADDGDTMPAPEPTTPSSSQNALLRAAIPKMATEHKFFDRRQLFALYVHGGVRTADTIKTCRSIAHGGVEDWIPTQSCGGIAAWQAGSVGLALGIGWIFHKTGHHKLERITPWVGTGASATGLTKSVFNFH